MISDFTKKIFRKHKLLGNYILIRYILFYTELHREYTEGHREICRLNIMSYPEEDPSFR